MPRMDKLSVLLGAKDAKQTQEALAEPPPQPVPAPEPPPALAPEPASPSPSRSVFRRASEKNAARANEEAAAAQVGAGAAAVAPTSTASALEEAADALADALARGPRKTMPAIPAEATRGSQPAGGGGNRVGGDVSVQQLIGRGMDGARVPRVTWEPAPAPAPEPAGVQSTLEAAADALEDELAESGSEDSTFEGLFEEPAPQALVSLPRAPLRLTTMAERKAVFDRMDVNRNGGLSLAEIDKAVLELYPEFDHKPSLMRAYAAADSSNDGFIERREFKKLLMYLQYFNGLWHEFEQLDADGDRRLSPVEFMQASAQVTDGPPARWTAVAWCDRCRFC